MKENNINYTLFRLSKSKFRSSFYLKDKDLEYINNKTLTTIKEHTYDIIKKRISSSHPQNDGKQTPTHGHPTFVAQHATATCCRTCLLKWHHIPKNKELSEEEINYIVTIIMTWIREQINLNSSKQLSFTTKI